MKFSVSFVLLSLSVIAQCGLLPVNSYRTEWSYNDTYSSVGPENWHNGFPHCAGDDDFPQSPTDIKTKSAVKETSGVLPLKFPSNNVSACLFNARNVGASLSTTPDDAHKEGLGFTNAAGVFFALAEVHFHWDDSDDHKGSEHSINGKRSAAEVHLVHYDARMGDLGQAAHAMNGTAAVIGIRFTTDESAFHSDNVSKTLESLLTPSKDIPYMDEDKYIHVDSWDPYNLVRDVVDYGGFYHYNGSLTTPPCFPGIQWFVAATDVYVPKSVLTAFRALHRLSEEDANNASNPYCDATNVRPIQNTLSTPYKIVRWNEKEDKSNPIFKIVAIALLGLVVILSIVLIVLIVCVVKKNKKNKSQKNVNESLLQE